MLDHLVGLDEVAFTPDIASDGSPRFLDSAGATPAQLFDAKVATTDVFTKLGVVDDETLMSEAAEKQATTAFQAFVSSDPNTQLAAVGALTLPESVRGAVSMLSQYQWRFVEQAEQLRSMAVSKILAETDHPDARVRLKALQMLGNVTEVALFTERVEIKKTDMTGDEIERAIREKLQKLAERRALPEVDVEDATIIEPEIRALPKESE